MSEKYKAISWNRQKKLYDLVLFGGILTYLLLFIILGAIFNPNATAETLIIRGFGTCAILLLHIVLIIGPLCRISPKFLPLLYNRRHLGVTTFFVGAVHGVFSIIQFHALGDVNPIISLFTSNTRFASVADFPFQPLGFFALIILFLMAITSHDFWLKNLTAPVWKTLHTLVYAAYALLIAHILLGVLQAETNPVLLILLAFGVCLVIGLHLFTGFREANSDKEIAVNSTDFVEVCAVDEIPEKRAYIAAISGERVAVFKYDGKISAVSNVCQHQNGPLGEGEIIDGCITCPWHGFQYLPENGQSPPPFTEKIPTFRTKVENGRVFINAKPEKAGTFVEPTEAK
jgi:methionine sulfoxide reductase heme-binding subunit